MFQHACALEKRVLITQLVGAGGARTILFQCFPAESFKKVLKSKAWSVQSSINMGVSDNRGIPKMDGL